MISSKHYLIFVNLSFFILGVVLILLGAAVQRSVNENFSQYSVYTNPPTSLTIAFGVLLFLTSLLALVSIECQSPILLFIYTIFSALLIIAEVSVGTTAFMAKPHMLSLMKESMRFAETKYNTEHSAFSSWNLIQLELNCCGVDRYQEWFSYLGNFSLPDSCCILYDVNCGSVAIPTGNYYQTGCGESLSRWARRHEISSAVLITFVVIFQILSLPCSHYYLQELGHFYGDSVSSFDSV